MPLVRDGMGVAVFGAAENGHDQIVRMLLEYTLNSTDHITILFRTMFEEGLRRSRSSHDDDDDDDDDESGADP